MSEQELNHALLAKIAEVAELRALVIELREAILALMVAQELMDELAVLA